MSDKKFVALSSIFFLLFIFGMGSLFVQEPLSNYLRATTTAVDQNKSIITAIPQVCSSKPNAISKCPNQKIKVAVYIRSENGDLLANKSVQLWTDPTGPNIQPSDIQITNKNGMAEFVLASETPLKVSLFAKEIASQKQLTQTLSVEFTQ